jgi:hypothetical protein
VSDSIAKAPSTDVLGQWEVMCAKAKTLVSSGFLPRAVRTPEQAIAIMQTGVELGLGPMQAMRSIHVIEGKPTISAELMAGLVFQRVPGALLRVAKTGADMCEVHAARPGQPPTVITWTLADARAAGIAGKDVWKKYGRAMLRSRAISEACRAVFPDATLGLYTPEELGAQVDDSGAAIIDATVDTVQPARFAEPARDESPPADEAPYTFAKGAHKGQSIQEVPADYIQRLLDETEHPIARRLRDACEAELDRRIGLSEGGQSEVADEGEVE